MTSAVGAALPGAPSLTEMPSDLPATPASTPAERASVPAAAPVPGAGVIVAEETVAALLTEQTVPPLNLVGLDLRSTDLRVLNLRGADLSGANLSGMDLSGIDLSGANLAGADLSGANLANARLTGVSAVGANLSNANLLDVALDGADFSRARFDGAYIGRQTEGMTYADLMTPTGMNLDGASFRSTRFQSIRFERSSVVGADFSSAVVDKLSFDRSNLANSNFDGVSGQYLHFFYSDLSGAGITSNRVRHTGFGASTLDGARFAGSSFNYTTFGDTNLSVADLTGVIREARSASFANTNLDRVDFGGFDFTGAFFNGARPDMTPISDYVEVVGSGASFDGTNFEGANFSGITVYEIDLASMTATGARLDQVMVEAFTRSMSRQQGAGNAGMPAPDIREPVPTKPAEENSGGEPRTDAPASRIGQALTQPVALMSATAALDALKDINERLRTAHEDASEATRRREDTRIHSVTPPGGRPGVIA